MPKDKQRIYFDRDIAKINEIKISFSFYNIDVYKCKPPVVQHPGDELYPEKGFDLYLRGYWPGATLENGEREPDRKIEIIGCFTWCAPKTYRRVKTYIIAGSPEFEAHCIIGYAMSRYLINELGYEILNWKD